MSVYGQWLAATIASGAASSSAVHLGAIYDYIDIQIPAMNKCKLYLQVAETLSGTYFNLGPDATTEEGTFNRADVWKLGGYEYIKVVATTSQSADRLIRVRGMRY